MNTERWMTVDGVEQAHGNIRVLIRYRGFHPDDGGVYALMLSEAALLAAEIQDAICGYVAGNLAGAVDPQTGMMDVPMLRTDDPKLRDALARCDVGRVEHLPT